MINSPPDDDAQALPASPDDEQTRLHTPTSRVAGAPATVAPAAPTATSAEPVTVASMTATPTSAEPVTVAPVAPAAMPTEPITVAPMTSVPVNAVRTNGASTNGAPEHAPSINAAATHGASATPPAPAYGMHNVLPNGTRIGEFEIAGIIGVGGFGIVYLANDLSLQRTVALKEYMPSAFARRSDRITVCVLSDEYADTFAAGLKSFVNEALLLAQFDHPSLVKVYRFWEANGTAYMVMPYYQGPTLKARLAELGAPPDEAWLRSFLSQLSHALAIIHAKQCFHRDIAPDNILMLPGDRPVLLDFGAARRVIEGREQAMTVIYKPAYAPIEQYGEAGDVGQGAWTDLYALASVLYYAITGKLPPQAVHRLVGTDPYVPLARQAQGQYSDAFLCAIDAALAVRPQDRPQDLAQFQALLERDTGPDTAHTTQPGTPYSSPSYDTTTHGAQAPSAPDQPVAAPPRNKAAWLGGAAALIALIGVGWLWRSQSGPSTPVASHPGMAASTLVGSTSATGTATPSSSPSAPMGAPAASAVVAAPPVATAPTRAPFEPARLLTELAAAGASAQAATVTMSRTQLQIGKDNFRFTVRAAQAGYVYVLMLDAERRHLYLMFPNALDKHNAIGAGKTLKVPSADVSLVSQGPAGIDQFVVMVSDQPRDFAAAGLQVGDPLSEFSFDAARRAYQSRSADTPLLAGEVRCADAAACSTRFGTAAFNIEEVR